MKTDTGEGITSIIGNLPYRMAFAGGWIDQPFVSRDNPTPPGSMVVVALEPNCRFMNRCGVKKCRMLIQPGLLNYSIRKRIRIKMSHQDRRT